MPRRRRAVHSGARQRGAALPGLLHGGDLLVASIGELMLCLIASGLAVHGRGYLVREELPRPVRPAFELRRLSRIALNLLISACRKPSTASV